MKTVTYDESKWKLVPIDSTDTMRDAGGQAIRKNGGEGTVLDLQADADCAWMAMVAEAPEMPVPDPNGAQRIYPPEFPKYSAHGFEQHMSREDLWDYACLCGWRAGYFKSEG